MLSPRMHARDSVKHSKEHERRFVAILEQQIADFPSGRLAETESPDFVVTTSNGKIGIEVTKIHRQATSNRLKREESEQEKIANEAVRIFETMNSVALEVKIHFSANNEFNKRNRRQFATAIASEFEAQLLVGCLGRLRPRRFCRGNASRDREERRAHRQLSNLLRILATDRRRRKQSFNILLSVSDDVGAPVLLSLSTNFFLEAFTKKVSELKLF
jgi:hypothetical protein